MIVSEPDRGAPVTLAELEALAAAQAVYLTPEDVALPAPAPEPQAAPQAAPAPASAPPEAPAAAIAAEVARQVDARVARLVEQAAAGPQVAREPRAVRKTPVRDADKRILYVVEREITEDEARAAEGSAG